MPDPLHVSTYFLSSSMVLPQKCRHRCRPYNVVRGLHSFGHVRCGITQFSIFSYEPNLRVARAWALAASTSRFRGEAVVTSELSSLEDAFATSSTARLNAFSFAVDGLANPLTFLTNWSAAARISSSVAGGSKLYSILMFLHTLLASVIGYRPVTTFEEVIET